MIPEDNTKHTDPKAVDETNLGTIRAKMDEVKVDDQAGKDQAGKDQAGKDPLGKSPRSSLLDSVLPSVDPLFDKERLLEKELGARWDIPDLASKLTEFPQGGCLVIHGYDWDRVKWAATTIALNKGYDACYHWDDVEPGNRTYEELFRRLAKRSEPTCLVLNYLHTRYHTRISDSWVELQKAVSKAEGLHGVIFYIRTISISKLVAQGIWPSNIRRWELEEPSRPAQTVDAKEAYRQIFVLPGETLEKVLGAEPHTYLPRTLAAVATLFPQLPVPYFERILRLVLQRRDLSLKEGEKDRVVYQAVRVWENAKVTFERQAGLIRTGSEFSPRIGFESPEHADTASQWAWEDPEAMMDHFVAAAALGILFDNDSRTRDKELFNAYVSSAIQLARRSSMSFAHRWLECLLADYQRWLKQKLGVSAPASDDLFHLLEAVGVLDRPELLDHFVQRFGVLGRCLIDGEAGDLVESFLEKLDRPKLRGLAVEILQELGPNYGPKRFERLIRLAEASEREDSNSSLWEKIAWWLADEECRKREPDTLLWAQVDAWLATIKCGVRSPAQRVAVALPSVLIEFFSGEFAEKFAFELGKLLVLEIKPGRRVEDVWSQIFQLEEFGVLAGRCTLSEGLLEKLGEDEWRALSWSRVLFRFALVPPETDLPRVCRLGKTALGAMKITRRTQIKSWWQFHAENFNRTRESLPRDSAHAAERELLLKNYRTCKELIKL